MPEVAHDEILLTDERRVRAIIKRLGQPRLDDTWLKVAAFGRPLEQLAFWEKYLLDRRTYFVWRDKADVWLTVYGDAGVLRRVVISGLKDRKDAAALRSEAWRTRAERQQMLTTDQIEQIAEEVATTRPERDYQEAFRQYLKDVRYYFRREGAEVVEGAGRFLPISKLQLRADDVELLRGVYAALPRTTFSPSGDDLSTVEIKDEPCPLCGGGGQHQAKKQAPLKDRKTSRNEVADAASKNIAKADLMAWVNARLTDEDKGGVWTLGNALYGDYESWLAERREDQTVGEHGESKAAKMSTTAWGTLMGKMFGKRRNGSGKTGGNLYNVRLKKRKR